MFVTAGTNLALLIQTTLIFNSNTIRTSQTCTRSSSSCMTPNKCLSYYIAIVRFCIFMSLIICYLCFANLIVQNTDT